MDMSERLLLLADGGATHIEWVGLDTDGNLMCRFETSGINAVLMTGDEIYRRLKAEVAPRIDGFEIGCVKFFGAGCVSDDIKSMVERTIAKALRAETVTADSDLLGAAIGLCGDRQGIVCILGTGSNSCYYDGVRLAHNVSPLGYILGDEGSSAVLGRRLVGDVLKKQLPERLCRDFLDRYGLDATSIVKGVYRGESPSRFLASFAPFLRENIHHPELKQLVLSEFCSFFRRNVSHYDVYGHFPINFTGSIAYHFSDILAEAARLTGYELGVIMQSPVEGMIEYYSSRAASLSARKRPV